METVVQHFIRQIHLEYFNIQYSQKYVELFLAMLRNSHTSANNSLCHRHPALGGSWIRRSPELPSHLHQSDSPIAKFSPAQIALIPQAPKHHGVYHTHNPLHQRFGEDFGVVKYWHETKKER